jgi:ribosomal protein L31
MVECELCPDDDKLSATIKHHPDYDYPEVTVDVCRKCHYWLHRWKIQTAQREGKYKRYINNLKNRVKPWHPSKLNRNRSSV